MTNKEGKVSDNLLIIHKEISNNLKRADIKSERLSISVATILTASIIGFSFLYGPLNESSPELIYGLASFTLFLVITFLISTLSFLDINYFDPDSNRKLNRFLCRVIYYGEDVYIKNNIKKDEIEERRERIRNSKDAFSKLKNNNVAQLKGLSLSEIEDVLSKDYYYKTYLIQTRWKVESFVIGFLFYSFISFVITCGLSYVFHPVFVFIIVGLIPILYYFLHLRRKVKTE